MKKHLIVLLTLLTMMALAGPSFALTVTDEQTTVIAGAPFVPSTGVTVSVKAIKTAYAAASKHESGNKCWSTLYDTSDIEGITTGNCGKVGAVLDDLSDSSDDTPTATMPSA